MSEHAEPSPSGPFPKLILCIVGDETLPANAKEILTEYPFEYEICEPDERMETAFRASACRVWPTLDEGDFDRLANHQSVVYVLTENYGPPEASRNAHLMLQAGCALLEKSGFGMKCESSGIAHANQFWKELLQEADVGLAGLNSEEDEEGTHVAQFWDALLRSFVLFPLVNEAHDYYSCGLHLLGSPDITIGQDVATNAFGEEADIGNVVYLWHVFSLYLLGEGVAQSIECGNTFRIDDDSPKFRLVKEPCTTYPSDDFFWNPYGMIRFADVLPE